MFKYYVYYLLGRARRRYFMQFPENEMEYKNSRMWFVVDGAMATTITLLIGGAFLASLLQALDISDTLNGIITSLASVVCVVQFFGIYWAKRMKKIKLFVCVFALLHRLLFTSLYFIPLLRLDRNIKIGLFISLFLLAHILGQIIGPSAGNWIASLNNTSRDNYFAKRDMIMVITSVVVSLIAGGIFDYYKAQEKTLDGFIFVGFILLICTVLNFLALSMIKEPRISFLSWKNEEMHGKLVKKRVSIEEQKASSETLIQIITRVLRDRRFRKIIIITLIWQSAFFLSTPYFGIYQISNLKLSYTYIMIMGVVGSVLRVGTTSFLGKLANKKSWTMVLEVSLAIMAVTFLINGFTNPTNGILMFAVFSILSGIGWGGIGPGLFTIQIENTPSGDRTDFLGVNAAIMGVCGFLSSLIGGSILSFIEVNKNQLFGVTIYGQQLLSALSGVLLIILVAYIHFNVGEIKKNKNK